VVLWVQRDWFSVESNSHRAALMTPKRKAIFETHQVKFVLAQFVDIHGTPRRKLFRLRILKISSTPVLGFAGFAVWGLGMQPNSPDFMAVIHQRSRWCHGCLVLPRSALGMFTGNRMTTIPGLSCSAD